MIVRYTARPEFTGGTDRFNTAGLGEVVVCWGEDGDSSECISELEVQLADGRWLSMRRAFADRDLITDNHNTRFFEPRDEDERARGYVL